jgi:Glycosyl transferase family 2
MTAFTVVMATYGRGRHILPSVRSVLGQSLADLELLVVGDASTDETEAVVAGVGDPRVRWLNLATRVGSQSGPNNAGIAAARGRWIAYLGHDDIWEPDHLERLAKLFGLDDPPDIAVSGAIFHLPNGVPGSQVTGLFADGADVRRYFFPPSSFAHSREVVERLGPWRMPMEIRAPVDEDLLLRAVDAGLRFRSTGRVTVHKFAAGHRYLSYVRQESQEQEAMLADLGAPGHAARVAALVEEAKRLGSFMPESDRDFSGFAMGELARANAERKGLRLPPLLPLGPGLTLRHVREEAALDWRTTPVLGFRLHRRNPRPRVLVPVTGTRARLRFTLGCREAAALGPLTLVCNGETLVATPGRRWFGLVAWFARYEVEIGLLPDTPTVLELVLSDEQRPIRRKRRLALGPLHLRPV